MATNSSHRQIEAMVTEAAPGTIFVPDDFAHCGAPDSIRSGLSRLCKNESIVRFAQGVYYKPERDKWDGSLREPSLDDVAKKIAQRDHARIAPTGVYALNRLGLSTQVPANVVYITDGAQRKINFSKGRTITLRHTSELRLFAYKSKVMQLIVLAMREIGAEDLIDTVIASIKKHIASTVSEKDFAHDIVLAPIWIRKILQQ